MMGIGGFEIARRREMVLGVCGSPRRNGNSDLLLRHILKGARGQGAECMHVRLVEYQFQPCIGCERCRKEKICTGLHDGMNLLYPSVEESLGLVVVSPTHNYNLTAWMKAFIDRLYCFYEFELPRPGPWSSRLAGQGRKAIVGAVCEQTSREDMGFTIEAMRLPLEALGYEVIDEIAVLGVFEKGGVKGQKDVLAKAETMGAKLARSILAA